VEDGDLANGEQASMAKAKVHSRLLPHLDRRFRRPLLSTSSATSIIVILMSSDLENYTIALRLLLGPSDLLTTYCPLSCAPARVPHIVQTFCL
jgi:hypothetical protein